MIRRPPRSTLDRSSAASDVYKRQPDFDDFFTFVDMADNYPFTGAGSLVNFCAGLAKIGISAVSYTHLRAHETVLDLVCRLLLEKKKQKQTR